MIKLLRAIAFIMIVIMAVAALRPFTAAETHAAEPSIHSVTLHDGGRTATYETSARTVRLFLEEAGVDLHPLDQLAPHSSYRIESCLDVQIGRAFYINLLVDGEEEQIKVGPGTTSGEILGSRQARLGTALIFEGDRQALLEEGDTLEFNTWRSREGTAVESIPYNTEFNRTQNLSMGVEKVRQQGVLGERRTEYKVVYIGGLEHTRETLGEYATDPVNQVIDLGIGGALGTLTNTDCPSFRYVKRVTMNASAYTAGFSCTGKSPGHPAYGITASGRRVEHGIVAVDPSVIPLGTRLYVEGYGFALAADTGSAIRGHKIDLFMYNLDDARRFGRRDITVFILE